MPKGLLWIASYPKSGNTWVRTFLANFLANQTTPVDINDLRKVTAEARSRTFFAAVGGRPSEEMTAQEINALRPAVHQHIASLSDGIIPVKTHIICGTLDGIPTISLKHTWKAIYIVRNPLDVAVSMSFHFGISVSRAADLLVSESAQTPGTATTVAQPMGRWDEHVDSWTSLPPSIVQTVRYEDLLSDPWSTFTRFRDFLGFPEDDERLCRAIEFSKFDRLSSAERESGFSERPDTAERFFRKGVAGEWRDHLSDADVEKIVERCGPTMARFGYLQDKGARLEPIC